MRTCPKACHREHRRSLSRAFSTNSVRLPSLPPPSSLPPPPPPPSSLPPPPPHRTRPPVSLFFPHRPSEKIRVAQRPVPQHALHRRGVRHRHALYHPCVVSRRELLQAVEGKKECAEEHVGDWGAWSLGHEHAVGGRGPQLHRSNTTWYGVGSNQGTLVIDEDMLNSLETTNGSSPHTP